MIVRALHTTVSLLQGCCEMRFPRLTILRAPDPGAVGLCIDWDWPLSLHADTDHLGSEGHGQWPALELCFVPRYQGMSPAHILMPKSITEHVHGNSHIYNVFSSFCLFYLVFTSSSVLTVYLPELPRLQEKR